MSSSIRIYEVVQSGVKVVITLKTDKKHKVDWEKVLAIGFKVFMAVFIVMALSTVPIALYYPSALEKVLMAMLSSLCALAVLVLVAPVKAYRKTAPRAGSNNVKKVNEGISSGVQGYVVDGFFALEMLMKNDRVMKAVKILEKDVESGIKALKDAGLTKEQAVFIVSAVLKMNIGKAIELVWRYWD